MLPAQRMTDRKQFKTAPQLVMDKAASAEQEQTVRGRRSNCTARNNGGGGKVTLMIGKEDCGPIEHVVPSA